jgi:hypothetical protein
VSLGTLDGPGILEVLESFGGPGTLEGPERFGGPGTPGTQGCLGFFGDP